MGFALLGLGAGAVYAALALGLVLVHRTSGVLHVAHGAVAMYVTYVFVELRHSGDLVLPFPEAISRLHVADDPGLVVCLSVALAFAAALGVFVWIAVFRPLRSAPPLARVVASVGVMLTLQAIAVLRFGSGNRAVAAVLPNSPYRWFGVSVPRDRVLLAVIVAAMAGTLWAAYRFTSFGLASRAVAEDGEAVARLGRSPDAVAAANWVLASILAGVGGVLAAPIASLNPVTYTLLVVPALAAALVGRLSSFPVTTAAALALGMAQSLLVKVQIEASWFPQIGVRDTIPLVVIVAAVAIRGRALVRRGEPAGNRLPPVGRPRAPVLTGVVAGAGTALAAVVMTAELRSALVTSLIGALVCLSLVVLTGYVGQLSLAQMALAGVSGFALSRLSDDLGLPFPLAPVLAAALAAGVGLLVGVPALRIRGVSLAVVTLAGAVAVEELIFRNPSLTRGFAGLSVPEPSLFGLDLGVRSGEAAGGSRLAFALLAVAVVAAAAVGVARLRNGALGRRLLAVRANERAAATAGVDVAGAKLVGFGMASFLAGLAGALIGYQQGRLSFGSFGVFVSLTYVALAYVGGIATISGALVGGALVAGGLVFHLLDEVGDLDQYHLLVTGLGLVLVTLACPDGATGALRRLVGWARHLRPGPPTPVPGEVAP